MRVTFDTNTIDRVTRPARFSRDPRQSEYTKVYQGLLSRQIDGFFCETMVTLEGIQNNDRVAVFGSTHTQMRRTQIGEHKFQLDITVEQPERKPLHPEHTARINAALDIGMRILRAPPRIGILRADGPDDIFLQDQDEAALIARSDKSTGVATKMDDRGIGWVQAY